jgi:hypothetical protein
MNYQPNRLLGLAIVASTVGLWIIPSTYAQPITDTVPDFSCTGAACGDLSITAKLPQNLPDEMFCSQSYYVPQAAKIYLQNRSSTKSVAGVFDLSHMYRTTKLVNGVIQFEYVDRPIRAPNPLPSVTLAPNNPNPIGPIGCDSFFDDSTSPPTTYHVVYNATATYDDVAPPGGVVPTGGGIVPGYGRPCSTKPPALQACVASDPDLPTGLYRFYSTTLYIDRQHLCIDVNKDGGNYQQYKCDWAPSESFYLTKQADACYTIRTRPNNYLTLDRPESDGAGIADLVGFADTQLIPGCAFDQTRKEFQIKHAVGSPPGLYEVRDRTEGRCIQVDRSDFHSGGAVNAIRCYGDQYEVWKIEKIPANKRNTAERRVETRAK